MATAETELKQRYTINYAGIRASTIAGAPFIGPGQPGLPYEQFMGILSGTGGDIGTNPLNRIAIYKRAVWVYGCTEARSIPLSMVPLKLYERTPDNHHNEVIGHPISRALADVNPNWDTSSTIRYDTEQSLCIHGRYHWLKVRNEADVVKELYGLPVQHVQVMPSYTLGQKVDVFRYQPRGNLRKDYPPKDIVYFRYGTPEQDAEGMAPLTVAIETTRADVSLQVAQNALSANRARPSMLVTVKPKWSEADYKRYSEELNRSYAGAVNAGKIMLLDNADNVKVDKVQLTPAEMEWIKEHQAHAQDICIAFRTPPGILMDFSEASRLANAGAMHRFYWELTLLPELKRWEDTLNWQLLWTEDWGRGGHPDDNGNWYSWEYWNGYYLEHDTGGIQALREDENARALRAQNAFGYGVTIDEARQMRGQDPLDDPEKGGIVLIPNNLVTLDSIVAGDGQPNIDVTGGSVGADITETVAQMNERGSKTGSSSLKTDLAQDNNLTRKPDQRPGSPAQVKAESRAVQEELRRWRAVAEKNIERALDFQTDIVPDNQQRQIREALALTNSFPLAPEQYVQPKRKLRFRFKRQPRRSDEMLEALRAAVMALKLDDKPQTFNIHIPPANVENKVPQGAAPVVNVTVDPTPVTIQNEQHTYVEPTPVTIENQNENHVHVPEQAKPEVTVSIPDETDIETVTQHVRDENHEIQYSVQRKRKVK